MKRNSTNWISLIVTLIVGILLIAWHERMEILSWSVIAVGIMFIMPGLYGLFTSIIELYKRKKGRATICNKNPATGILTGIGGVILGTWMVITPDIFIGMIAYLFAAILVGYGIYQAVSIGMINRTIRISWLLYLVPAILIAAGLIILFTSIRTMNSIVVLTTGILLLASSINSLMKYVSEHSAKRLQETADAHNRQ